MLTLALIAAVAAPSVGKTMAADDWHSATIIAVGSDLGTGAPVLHLRGSAAPEESYLKLICVGGSVQDALHYSVKSPRDSASGLATGKRTHHPVTFVKEWGAATPQLAAIKPSYDVKKVEGTGARMTADASGWTPVNLAQADGLCPAAEAAVRATKSRSNIQNN